MWWKQCLTSTGLKRTELKLSTPQVNERIGLLLCSSQMSTCWPHVANTASFWWWSSPVKTVCKRQESFSPELIHDFTLQKSEIRVDLSTDDIILMWPRKHPYQYFHKCSLTNQTGHDVTPVYISDMEVIFKNTLVFIKAIGHKCSTNTMFASNYAIPSYLWALYTHIKLNPNNPVSRNKSLIKIYFSLFLIRVFEKHATKKYWCVFDDKMTDTFGSYLAKNCVNGFLLLSIAGWLHSPLLDCFVITNL